MASRIRPDGRRRITTMLICVLAIVLVATSCRTETDLALARADSTGADNPSSSTATSDGYEVSDNSEVTETAPEDASATGTDEATTAPDETDDQKDEGAEASPPPQATGSQLTGAPDTECGPFAGRSAGLTSDGEEMFSDFLTDHAAPSYELTASIDPATGYVDGTVQAIIPEPDAEILFRVFAGMEAFDSGLEISELRVDGNEVDWTLDRALLRVPVPSPSADASDTDEPVVATVDMAFRYTIGELVAGGIFDALGGDSLAPDAVGLLGRTSSGMQLGHWFPVWLPAGTRSDPDPSGFGDIGAFPAALICATIEVPADYSVISSGVAFKTDGAQVHGGAGLRDLAILVSDAVTSVEGEVDGVAVRVWGPPGNQEALQTVLLYSVSSQQTLVDAFGPYPWSEIDVVAAPLGAGVGGMEWPGMVWIEQSLFAGGIPGLGDLEGLDTLFGDSELNLEDFLGDFGGSALSTAREWTVAHELGHEWWHAVVGNDSIASPAVDEPLAQFSACIAMQKIHPDSWREICEAQTIDQYAQNRAFGVNDAIAEQPSDGFESALQYGAVVYGKAPGFYLEVADLIGWDALIEALAAYVDDHAFELVSTDSLRQHLSDAAGDDGEQVAALWDRWFRSALGDEDIEPASPLGLGAGALGGGALDGALGGDLGDLEDSLGEGQQEMLNELLEGLESGEIDLDELFEDLLGETPGG